MSGVTLDVSGIEVAKLHEEHVGEVLALMNDEGWYYYDHAELGRYLDMGQDCYVLLENGRVAGSLFTTNFGNQAWIGNIVVARKFRSRGLAGSLLREVVRHLHEDKGVPVFRLGSVPLAIGLYKRTGFMAEAFTTAQEAALPFAEGYERVTLGGHLRVVRMRPGHVREVAALDERYFRSDRAKLLEALFADSIKEGCFCLEAGGRVAGFLMVRRRRASRAEGRFAEGPDHAYRLGPCCVSPEFGMAGFKALLQEAIPVVNAEVRRMGGSARMYAVFPRSADRDGIYGDTRELARAMGVGGDVDVRAVFAGLEGVFAAQPSAKNDGQWQYMQGLGFRQEYFEQVMCYAPGAANSTGTKADSEGIYASATPGDKA